MDLIDRKAAIDAVSDCGICIQRIVDLPSAQPERKKGKWIRIGDNEMIQCSECFEEFDYLDGLFYLCHGQELPDYCPNCGARMEEAEK